MSSDALARASEHQTMGSTECESDNVLIKLAYISILKPAFIVTDASQSLSLAYSGIVLEAGKNANNIRVGDKIVGTNVSNNDITFSTENVSSYENGALITPKSGYLSVSSGEIHKIPDEITLREGPSIGYLGMCIHLFDKVKFRSGSTACVIGSGLVGSLLAQMLPNNGVKVTVISNNEYQNELLYKYDVNTLKTASTFKDFDYLINTTEIDHWSNLLLSSKNEHAVVIQLGSDKSFTVHGNNDPNNLVTITKPNQTAFNNASSKVTSSQVDLSDYTNSVFELDNTLPLASNERPTVNILVEISPDLAFV